MFACNQANSRATLSGPSVLYGQAINVSFPDATPPFNATRILKINENGTTCWENNLVFVDTNWQMYDVTPLNRYGKPTDNNTDWYYAKEGQGLMFATPRGDPIYQNYHFTDMRIIGKSASSATPGPGKVGVMGWSCIVLAAVATLGAII